MKINLVENETMALVVGRFVVGPCGNTVRGLEEFFFFYRERT